VQFALPFPRAGCHGFSPWQLQLRFFIRRSSGACRRFGTPTHAEHTDDRSRWLLTPCALRLREPNQTSQPLTPSVASWALPRDLRISRSQAATCLSSGDDGTHAARTFEQRRPVRGDVADKPRVPSVGSILGLSASEALRVPCYVRAKVLAPFRSTRSDPLRQLLESPPSRATSLPLGSPRGSPRELEEDASYRPLQPNHDTSTRGPFDYRARNLRCGQPPDASPTEIEFFLAAPNHLAAIQPRLGTCLTTRLQLRSCRTHWPWSF
jgi:hypothetical protein